MFHRKQVRKDVERKCYFNWISLFSCYHLSNACSTQKSSGTQESSISLIPFAFETYMRNIIGT